MDQLIVIVLPFVVNAVMFGIKYLAGMAMVDNGPNSRLFLRSILIALSIVGSVAASIANGTPLDETGIRQQIELVLQGLVSAYVSHAVYNSSFRS